MWRYNQRTGQLFHDADFVANGYAGHGPGKNNPALQAYHNVGPIPVGRWTITGMIIMTSRLGPFVLVLGPAKDTETFGRTGFRIHGDSRTAPGTASEGCIILPRAVREEIWASGDRDLDVFVESSDRQIA